MIVYKGAGWGRCLGADSARCGRPVTLELLRFPTCCPSCTASAPSAKRTGYTAWVAWAVVAVVVVEVVEAEVAVAVVAQGPVDPAQALVAVAVAAVPSVEWATSGPWEVRHVWYRLRQLDALL